MKVTKAKEGWGERVTLKLLELLFPGVGEKIFESLNTIPVRVPAKHHSNNFQ